MKDFVRVELRGGIGNQLFQYFAGAYLAWKCGKKLQVDQTHLHYSHEKHVTDNINSTNNFLNSLSLPGEALIRSEHSFLSERVIRKILKRTGYFKHNLLTPNIFLKSYESREIGYEENLGDKYFERIAGYFQTYRYFDELIGNKPEYIPHLKNPTDWFEKISKKIESDSPYLLHLRKHYSSLDGIYVQCGKKYYEDAINRLDDLFGKRPIFVFGATDLEVEKFIPHHFLYRCQLIEKPVNSPDVESLVLMSKSKSLIASNSTFSWWAGKFMKSETEVVVPKDIYIDRPNPKDYYPINWIKI